MIKNVVIALAVFGIAGSTCMALAQTTVNPLPSAGLTPSNFFYFLDRLGEKIQEFFTFKPQDKALLQIEFAAERIAEIKLELEVNGPDAKGVADARRGLTGSIERANIVLKGESEKGVDTRESENEFDSRLQSLLQQASDEDSQGLNEEIDKMEQELSDDFAELQGLDNSRDIDGEDKAGQSNKSIPSIKSEELDD